MSHYATMRALRRAAAALAACLPLLAAGQPFPSRPLHIVVPFAPGGAVDTVARIVGAQLSEQVGQPVIVENKPGGQANIGAEAVARSAPDGYTMLLGANGLATNPTLMHMSFEPLKAFAAVARVGYAPLVLVVPEKSPAKTVGELVAYIKAHPGKTNYGSAAVGGSGHLASELFKMKSATDSQHVPYKGGAPALTDLIAGRLDYMLINPLEAAPHVKAGKLRALAVSSSKRIASLPDVPTFAEAGMKDFQASVWWGFVVPAATPKDVVARLDKEVLKALEQPEVKSRLERLGAVVDPQDSQAFGAFLRSETQTWAEVIRKAGIKAE
ncbi:MAG TPA: tripartite tricarboxylate transporter substrate binding protein [Usitatibacter sp.]|nr:tripartite tricarboxylate transporter substrate binding protein [Usitatibacter sp.]